jgi:predicted oxidoreductase (fatty acid repression mutant protein)
MVVGQGFETYVKIKKNNMEVLGMKGKVISIRLNLEKLTDKKAEEILSGLPTRRKSEFVRNAIVAYDNYEYLIEIIKQALLEAMDEQELQQAEKKNEENGGFDDYLKSL